MANSFDIQPIGRFNGECEAVKRPKVFIYSIDIAVDFDGCLFTGVLFEILIDPYLMRLLSGNSLLFI